MRLAEFIRTNREPILAEWETFARTCAPASRTMDITALRDHANEMLTVIATDLSTPQDKAAQAEKGMGQAEADDPSLVTAAEEHGAGRAESGFTVAQMVAEYRALRASVIRLWTREIGALEAEDIEDLTRFNEAIDQSLAESVERYNEELEQAKEIFLAILGHDLRLPLGAIYMSATFMLDLEELKEPHKTLTSRIASSATRTLAMVGDLLDFTRGRLGGGIPVVCTDVSMGRVVHDVVDEICAAHPGRQVKIETRGDEVGCWDAARIGQAVSNLVGNAIQHGSPDAPIEVEVRGDGDHVLISVHNGGTVIAPAQLDGIFNPMKSRQAPTGGGGPTGSLGLGLYIAERIVTAHQGQLDVQSTKEKGTTFTIRLPRTAKAAAGKGTPAALARPAEGQVAHA